MKIVLASLVMAVVTMATMSDCSNDSHVRRCNDAGGTVHSVDVTDATTGKVHRNYWCSRKGEILFRW